MREGLLLVGAVAARRQAQLATGGAEKLARTHAAQRLVPGAPSACAAMNDVGKPDSGDPHVRFEKGGPARARFVDGLVDLLIVLVHKVDATAERKVGCR